MARMQMREKWRGLAVEEGGNGGKGTEIEEEKERRNGRGDGGDGGIEENFVKEKCIVKRGLKEEEGE